MDSHQKIQNLMDQVRARARVRVRAPLALALALVLALALALTLALTPSSALHVLFSVGHFFGSESFYFCAIPVAAWSTVGASLPVPGIVTFFVVNLYVGNYLKNLFALPRPTASPGG